MEVVLFPGFHLCEGDLKRILSFFDTLTVPLPWEAAVPSFVTAEGGSVRVLYPPEDLRPVEGFRSLLSEYKTWMASNPDKGYALFLQAEKEQGSRESSTWEIRQAIRRGGGAGGPSETAEKTTRWHLVLHLANETWETQREADRALRAVKEMGSPLRDVTEEGDERGLLDDLPGPEADTAPDEEFLERVFDAWSGLFGQHVGENGLLVTTDRHVMKGLSDLWAEFFVAEGTPDLTHRFTWPDISGGSLEEVEQRRAALLREGGFGELREMIRRLCREPVEGFSLPADRGDGMKGNLLRFNVRHFPPPARPLQGRRKEFLRRFSGNTLFHMEKMFRGD